MLVSAFILGLLGSLHCIGMCGPIAFVLPVDRKNSFKKAIQVLFYHLGRMLAYMVLGLFFGSLGKGLVLFGMQQQLSIIIGVVIILLVLMPHHILNKISLVTPIYKLIANLKSKLAEQFKSKTFDTFFTIGFLNGFLPCGLVYMAVFSSVAFGNTLTSAV